MKCLWILLLISCTSIDLEFDDYGGVDKQIYMNEVWDNWDGELPIPFSDDWYKLKADSLKGQL